MVPPHPSARSVLPHDVARLTVLAADASDEACAVLHDLCEAQDVSLVRCADGASALFLAGRLQPDLILVSASLPGLTPSELIRAVRRHAAVPIVLAVGDGQTDRAAQALAAGAGELTSWPYSAAEIRSLLRDHLERTQARKRLDATLSVGSVELNGLAYEVHVGGRPLNLPLRDFELLRLLMLHADRVVRVEQIRQHVWAGALTSSNTIAVHVRRLRLCLGAAAQIINVRGVGYRLVADAQPHPTSVEPSVPAASGR